MSAKAGDVDVDGGEAEDDQISVASSLSSSSISDFSHDADLEGGMPMSHLVAKAGPLFGREYLHGFMVQDYLRKAE